MSITDDQIKLDLFCAQEVIVHADDEGHAFQAAGDANVMPLGRRQPWPSSQVICKPGNLSSDRLFAQSVVSPLRYPGAKRQLVPIVEQIIRANFPPPTLLLEPFCGGATTSLRLLGTGAVEHGILADADNLVAAFWHAAAFDTDWLIDAMNDEPVTVERWEWWRAYSAKTRRDMALKCIFLNRTTFSGILHGRAGPIGGKKQGSDAKYPIDCRFNKSALAERIAAVGELASAGRLLDVWACDWRESLERLRREYKKVLEPDEILVYLDPPYVDKAPYLYQWSFQDDEHGALASHLAEAKGYRWLLSYDDSPRIRELYPQQGNRSVLHVKHRYSAAGLKATPEGKRRRAVREELLVTDLPVIPSSPSYHALSDWNCDSCNMRTGPSDS
ncbi:DNA adenine methylase [Micromonospora sp. DT201]|uniref:DNA adenine methylase n=1 Tax=Micromonospora sp. DT201 TaxID=3393442 RepID=UPI003CEF7409